MSYNWIPKKINPHSVNEMLIEWNDGSSFVVPFFELRFECPCAACVDEKTGKRTLRREDIQFNVRPVGIQPVGRYAIQIQWSDRHATGIYHFDRLKQICDHFGLKNSEKTPEVTI